MAQSLNTNHFIAPFFSSLFHFNIFNIHDLFYGILHLLAKFRFMQIQSSESACGEQMIQVSTLRLLGSEFDPRPHQTQSWNETSCLPAWQCCVGWAKRVRSPNDSQVQYHCYPPGDELSVDATFIVTRTLYLLPGDTPRQLQRQCNYGHLVFHWNGT